MAKKKGKAGCIFGCLGLLVIGGGVVLATGLAGGGAWLMMGSDSSMFDFGGDGLDAPSAEFLDLIAEAPDVPAIPEDGEDAVADAGEDAEDAAAARDALEAALAMEADPAPAPAPAPAPEPDPEPAPSSGSSSSGSSSSGSSSGSSGSSNAGSSSSSPAPKPKPAPSTGGGGSNNVTVTGSATVVLVSGGARYNMPGRVPAGSYDIEATFPGEPAVVVGTIKVNGTHTIACSERMGTCRVR